MYRKALLEWVCKLVEVDFRPELVPEKDNFAEGYQARVEALGECNDLQNLLLAFYNNGFKYEESPFCDGYGKLVDFIYGIKGDDNYVNEIVEELDEITNAHAFRDYDGDIIDNDDEIRYLRCLHTLYDLYELSEDYSDKTMSIEVFAGENFNSLIEVKKYLTLCDEDEAAELMKEWTEIQEKNLTSFISRIPQ